MKVRGAVSSKVVRLVVALRQRKFRTNANICVIYGVSLRQTKVKAKHLRLLMGRGKIGRIIENQQICLCKKHVNCKNKIVAKVTKNIRIVIKQFSTVKLCLAYWSAVLQWVNWYSENQNQLFFTVLICNLQIEIKYILNL